MKYTKALALIKQFEGCKLHAYLDTGGVPTIAFGTITYPDGSKVKMGDTCTEDQASEYLEHHFNKMVPEVLALIKFPDLLSENQMSAILSLVYNIGAGAFKDSTLLKMINMISPLTNADEFNDRLAVEFLRWNKVAGHEVAGLTNRRAAERTLFLT